MDGPRAANVGPERARAAGHGEPAVAQRPAGALDAALAHLAAHPGRHGLYPALRLLQRWLADGGDELAPALHVRNSDSLAFAGSEIESLTILAGDAGSPPRVELVPAFGSLLGAHGALPALYTELLAERGDAAPRAFLDLFAQRLAALGYRAWVKSRPALQAERPRHDALRAMLLAVAGVAPHAHAHAAADGAAVAFHAAALLRRRSADSIERVLSHWFDVPVRLQPWAGGWHALPRDDQARLGGGAATLGHDAVLGSRVRQCDLRVRLAIGPLARAGLDALLPGAGGWAALRRWLDRLLGDAVEVEVRLVLRAADVVPARLAGGPADTAPRLGFDAYLLSRRAEVDRDDAGYLLFAAP